MNFKFLKSFFLFYLLLITVVVAQQKDRKYTYSSGVEVFSGFIVKHHEEMGHLIKGHPSGIRLNFIKNSYGAKAWEQRYNYPDFRVSLSYYDLKNEPVLGEVISLNAALGFHLLDFQKRRDDLQFNFGFGLSYFTKIYDPETNNKNNVVSSHMPWSFILRLSYYYGISDRLRAGTALQISHFSNGSSSVPNFGLNVVNINIGLKYTLNDSKIEYQKDRIILYDINKKSYINFDFRMGVTELAPIGSGKSPYYAGSIFWNKRIGAKSIVDAGIEGFMNKALEKQVVNNYLLVEGTPDYKSIGFMVGHELVLEKLAIVTQLGVYVYKDYKSEEWLYTKLGMKYYFTDNIFGSMILKTHFAVAEVMEFGIGYRL